MLDEPVLRLTDAKPLRQWPIFAGKLQAGELNGLSNGTIMALYNDAADADDKVLAYGEIEAAGATQSRVAAIAYPCGAPLNEDGSCPTPPDEAAFKKGRFARVVEPGVDLSVVLSEPVRVDPKDGHDYGAAIAALEERRSFRRPVAPRFAEQERLRCGGRAARRQARLLGHRRPVRRQRRRLLAAPDAAGQFRCRDRGRRLGDQPHRQGDGAAAHGRHRR